MIQPIEERMIKYKTKLDYTCAYLVWPCRCNHPLHKHCKMHESPLYQSMCPEYKVEATAELIDSGAV